MGQPNEPGENKCSENYQPREVESRQSYGYCRLADEFAPNLTQNLSKGRRRSE